jgi:putative phosphoesterase
MKIVFVSDVHGRLPSLKLALAAAEREVADLLVLPGDLLYHGPRNGLFDGYDPAACAPLLNAWAEKIVAVRGNCDSEVDQMLLSFPMMGDYAHVVADGQRFFVTHGHKFFGPELPPLPAGTVVVSGHTHLPVNEANGELIFFNPGSVSLPKGGHPATYGVWTKEDGLAVKTLDGQTYL